jgi:hypothetical protein
MVAVLKIGHCFQSATGFCDHSSSFLTNPAMARIGATLDSLFAISGSATSHVFHWGQGKKSDLHYWKVLAAEDALELNRDTR